MMIDYLLQRQAEEEREQALLVRARQAARQEGDRVRGWD